MEPTPNEKSWKWLHRTGIVVLVILLLGLIYVLSPILLALSVRWGWLDPLASEPRWLQLYCAPLEWLMENSQLYKSYIEWLEKIAGF